MIAATQTLLKFGKQKHMHRMYEEGEIKIHQASWFSDCSLNPATQDDELAIETRKPSEDVSVWINGPGTDGFQELEGVSGDLIYTRRTADYYVYCMILTPNPQLFDDFQANSCVIVHEPFAFTERLKGAVQLQLPDWSLHSGCVKYIELYPTSFMRSDIDLAFTKRPSACPFPRCTQRRGSSHLVAPCQAVPPNPSLERCARPICAGHIQQSTRPLQPHCAFVPTPRLVVSQV